MLAWAILLFPLIGVTDRVERYVSLSEIVFRVSIQDLIWNLERIKRFVRIRIFIWLYDYI